jgi:plasmid maintenance system antidote protein VapI
LSTIKQRPSSFSLRLFGNTPEFWLNAQRAVDLWEAEQNCKKEIESIHPIHAISFQGLTKNTM